MTKWIEGEPEKALFGDLKIDAKKSHEVVSYRCTRCGLLQSYVT